MPSFKCKDIGMDCDFKVEAPTKDQLMKKISEHASSIHDIKTIDADLKKKIEKAIKD